MFDKSKIFGVLGSVIILLVIILITINALYIKTACSTKQCILVNVLTILLLVWATAFWLVVMKYSKKTKK